MAGYEVMTGQLRAAANEVSEQNQQLANALKSLQDEENSLAAMWEGDAKTTFRNNFNNGMSQFQTFATTVQKYLIELQGMAERYERTERENAEIAGKR